MSYPGIARVARIEGKVTASVVLGSTASAQEISTKVDANTKGHVLSDAVEGWIRHARFRPDCGGKTVTMIFQFKIVGQPKSDPTQAVTFEPPNVFRITSEQGQAQP